jgi:hypothetical protein
MLTLDEAGRHLASGHLTLRELARRWGVPVPDAYQRLYGRPMPAAVALPARTERAYWRPRRRRSNPTRFR